MQQNRDFHSALPEIGFGPSIHSIKTLYLILQFVFMNSHSFAKHAHTHRKNPNPSLCSYCFCIFCSVSYSFTWSGRKLWITLVFPIPMKWNKNSSNIDTSDERDFPSSFLLFCARRCCERHTHTHHTCCAKLPQFYHHTRRTIDKHTRYSTFLE